MGGQPELLFKPSVLAPRVRHTGVNEPVPPPQVTIADPGPIFSQCFQQFPEPVITWAGSGDSPINKPGVSASDHFSDRSVNDIENEKVAEAEFKRKELEEKALAGEGETGLTEAESFMPDSEVRVKRTGGVATKATSGNFLPDIYKTDDLVPTWAVKHGDLPGQNHVQTGALAQGIQCLQQWHQQGASTDSRSALTTLFDHGEALFGKDSYPVDRDSTLRFIALYRAAVRHERKPDNRTDNKKEQRLQAIDEINRYVQTLSNSDTDQLRLAIQLCGRVRERRLVRQETLDYCGGFAVLQAVWGRKPLVMTRAIIDLVRHGKATIKTDAGDQVLTRPKDMTIARLSRFGEALADTLPLCPFYDCTQGQGSTSREDAAYAALFGLSPTVYRERKFGNKDRKNDKFLKVLESASKQKIPIRGGIKGKLADFLEQALASKQRLRKNRDKIIMSDQDFLFQEKNPDAHGVIFEDVEDAGNTIRFKLYTWGRTHRCEMNRDTFLSLVDKRMFVILDNISHASIKGDGNGGFVDPGSALANKEYGLPVNNLRYRLRKRRLFRYRKNGLRKRAILKNREEP